MSWAARARFRRPRPIRSDSGRVHSMPRYVTPSAEDGKRLINDFIDETFGDLDANPEFVAMLRTVVPEMPADPSPEQLGAWAELSELVRDADFKARVRRM